MGTYVNHARMYVHLGTCISTYRYVCINGSGSIRGCTKLLTFSLCIVICPVVHLFQRGPDNLPPRKLFKKKFACGCAVVKGENTAPDTVDIQGGSMGEKPHRKP